MKKLTITASLAALVFATVASGPALSRVTARSGKFKGTYAGSVTEKVDGQRVNAAVRGKGAATLLGKGTMSGKVVAITSTESACAPFSGPGVISGTKGKLNVKVRASRGCAASEDDRNNISVSGTAKVSGGTKAFRKATGSLHFSGHYNRSTGAFTVKLTGNVRY